MLLVIMDFFSLDDVDNPIHKVSQQEQHAMQQAAYLPLAPSLALCTNRSLKRHPMICIPSYVLIVIVKIDVPWAQPVCPDELLVSGWSLWLSIASQHALDAHAHALHILDWTPALATQ